MRSSNAIFAITAVALLLAVGCESPVEPVVSPRPSPRDGAVCVTDFKLSPNNDDSLLIEGDYPGGRLYDFIYDGRGDTKVSVDGLTTDRNRLMRAYNDGRLIRAELDIDWRRYGHVDEVRFFTR